MVAVIHGNMGTFNYIVILQAAKVSTAEHGFVGVDMMGGGE